MTAERKAIRLHVSNLLKGKTAAGDKVFASRAFPAWSEELPVILVYTNTEDSVLMEAAPKRYKRTVRLSIECLAKADSAVDDALDDMAEAVENAIALDDTLAGNAIDCRVSQVETTLIGEGEQVFAACRVTVDVDYIKLAPLEQPDDVVTPFNGADIEVDVQPSVNGRANLQQTVNLPQD